MPSTDAPDVAAPSRRATRRAVLATGLGLGAVLLTGCTGGAEEDVPEGPATDGDAPYPREVEHAAGTTALERRPERIVTKYQIVEFDVLVALGLRPVATAGRTTLRCPWSADVADEVESLGGTDGGEWPLEALAAVEPDLILCQDGEYEKAAQELPAIAPVVVLDANDSPDWREDVRVVGSALALEAEAEAAVAQTDAVLATARDDLAGLASRSVRVFDAAGSYLRSTGSGIGVVLGELGLSTPDEEDYAALSAERLGDLAGTDLLLVVGYDDQLVDVTLANPLFARVPQVEAGRWARLDPVTGAAFDASVLSLRYAVPLLARALGSAAAAASPGARF